MLGFISKMFGGSKSEKDVKIIQPMVEQINQHFTSFQSISNDELRNKTEIFRGRIREHVAALDEQIARLTEEGENLPFTEMAQKEELYKQIDQLKKDRDKQFE